MPPPSSPLLSPPSSSSQMSPYGLSFVRQHPSLPATPAVVVAFTNDDSTTGKCMLAAANKRRTLMLAQVFWHCLLLLPPATSKICSRRWSVCSCTFDAHDVQSSHSLPAVFHWKRHTASRCVSRRTRPHLRSVRAHPPARPLLPSKSTSSCSPAAVCFCFPNTVFATQVHFCAKSGTMVCGQLQSMSQKNNFMNQMPIT
jgi:hypothetical protein